MRETGALLGFVAPAVVQITSQVFDTSGAVVPAAKTKVYAVLECLRASYWFVPSAEALAAVALSITSLWLEEDLRDEALRYQGITRR